MFPEPGRLYSSSGAADAEAEEVELAVAIAVAVAVGEAPSWLCSLDDSRLEFRRLELASVDNESCACIDRGCPRWSRGCRPSRSRSCMIIMCS